MENNENNENTNTNEQRRLENIQRLNELVELRRNSNEPLTIPINFELTILTGINLDGADLRGASLSGANLSNATLTNCDFTDAHLEDVDLMGSNLTDSDLTNTFLNDANLSNAILINANLSNSLLQHATLERANLENAELNETNLSFAELMFANFSNADLFGAILSNSDAADANFSNANLSYTDFYEADITRAIFTNANINRSVFDGANTDQAIDLVTDDNNDDMDIDEELFQYMEPQDNGVQNVQQPRGLAYEIHEKFAKILPKKNEYLALINQPDKQYPNILFYRYIQNSFESHIRELFPGDSVKLDEFNTAFERINTRIPENLKHLILGSIDFAFSQDDDFKREYIKIFLDESCRAYTGPNPLNNLSCVNGIIERFITAVGGAVQVLCVAGCENETYQKLDKLFNTKFNIAEAANEWWNTIAETAEIQILTKEQRKEDFMNYLRNKARELDNYDAQIEQKIIDYANEIDYSFENLALGGSRKTKKPSKTSKTRKVRKSKKKQQSKKSKKSRKSKKSKKHRNSRKHRKSKKKH